MLDKIKKFYPSACLQQNEIWVESEVLGKGNTPEEAEDDAVDYCYHHGVVSEPLLNMLRKHYEKCPKENI